MTFGGETGGDVQTLKKVIPEGDAGRLGEGESPVRTTSDVKRRVRRRGWMYMWLDTVALGSRVRFDLGGRRGKVVHIQYARRGEGNRSNK